jgi:hypothetical protein
VKWLQSKATVAAGAGVLIVTGLAVAGLRRSRVEEPDPTNAAPRPEKTKPTPPAARTCPTETAVEDPELKLDPDEFKRIFAKAGCMKNPSGEIGCTDETVEACQKRMQSLRRAYGTASDCVEKPPEVFCAVFATAYGETIMRCFEKREACEKHRKSRAERSKICRITPACERRSLLGPARQRPTPPGGPPAAPPHRSGPRDVYCPLLDRSEGARLGRRAARLRRAASGSTWQPPPRAPPT